MDDRLAPATGILRGLVLSFLGWSPLFLLAFLGWWVGR